MKKFVSGLIIGGILSGTPYGSKAEDLLKDNNSKINERVEEIINSTNRSENIEKKISLQIVEAIKKKDYINIDLIIDSGESLRENKPYGMNTNDPIYFALYYDYFPELEHILDRGFKIISNNDFASIDKFCLETAIKKKQFGIFKKLLISGLDPNSIDYRGKTLLMTLIEEGDLEGVKILIENNFDPNFKFGKYNETAINSAIDKGQIEIVKYLIEHGANIYQESNWGNYLFYSILKGKKDLTEFFLDMGLNINEVHEGNSPLTYAMLFSDKLIPILIQRGADVNQKIEYESIIRSPLDKAIRSGNFDVVKDLLEFGAIIDDFHGRLALTTYIKNLPFVVGINVGLGNTPEDVVEPYKYYEGSIGVFENLVNSGGDVLMVDEKGDNVYEKLQNMIINEEKYLDYLNKDQDDYFGYGPWKKEKAKRNIDLFNRLVGVIEKKYKEEKAYQNEMLKFLYKKFNSIEKLSIVPLSKNVFAFNRENVSYVFIDFKQETILALASIVENKNFWNILGKTKEGGCGFEISKDGFDSVDRYDNPPVKKNTYPYYLAWKKIGEMLVENNQ